MDHHDGDHKPAPPEALTLETDVPCPAPASPDLETKPQTLETVSEVEGTAGVVLTEELREKIVRQVEYYFSDENLPTDQFLLNFIKKNKPGFVPIAVIASFRKMRKLVEDHTLIAEALRTSSQLVVSENGKRVRRSHPLPDSMEDKHAKLRVVVVKNTPEDHTIDDIRRIFEKVGNIKTISVTDMMGRWQNVEKMPIGDKMRVLIQYETIEAAMDAVTTLNDETNWRNGMHVKLLHKDKLHGALKPCGILPKNGAPKGCCEVDLKSAELNDEIAEAVEDHGVKEKKEQVLPRKYPSRNQQLHKQPHNANGRGRWHPQSSLIGENPKQIAPTPRMPDGTKGFTFGRGKLIT